MFDDLTGAEFGLKLLLFDQQLGNHALVVLPLLIHVDAVLGQTEREREKKNTRKKRTGLRNTR